MLGAFLNPVIIILSSEEISIPRIAPIPSVGKNFSQITPPDLLILAKKGWFLSTSES